MSAVARIVAAVIGCFVAAGALATVLFVEWLHAPRSHVIAALEYLGLSGVLSLGIGTVAVLAAARWAPRLSLKIALASLFGGAVAIVNVLVTPLLMFQEASDRTILVITLIYFFVLSLAFAALVAAITTRSLAALHAGALRLAAGDLGTHVRVEGADEVADLGRAFNRMSAEVAGSFERERRMETSRRELIAAVSHDLRTPVTSIRAMAEAVLDGVVSDEAMVTQYLQRIRAESERLAGLIDDLFEVARIESGTLELRLAPVPLDDLVGDTIESLRLQAEERGVALAFSSAHRLPAVAIDAPRMQRVIANLVQNALRHTPPGGRVEVAVRQGEAGLEVEVVDTGEGIAPEDRPHVFERFYRGEKSRSRETGGAGLGLAIARGIVEAHHGTLRLEDGATQGSRFVIRLQGMPATRRDSVL